MNFQILSLVLCINSIQGLDVQVQCWFIEFLTYIFLLADNSAIPLFAGRKMLSPSPSFGSGIRHVHTSGGMAGYRCAPCKYFYNVCKKDSFWWKKRHSKVELDFTAFDLFRWFSSCRPGDWCWPEKTSGRKVSLFKTTVWVSTIIVVIFIVTMVIVVLIRDVELNLVTDGLESIFHQPECSSWQAEYTEIGTENGESSSGSSSRPLGGA